LQKCYYCDFNSIAVKSVNNVDFKHYLKALLKDLKEQLQQIPNRSIASIYIGGGTPSILDGNKIYTLLSEIKKQISLATKAEITIEINPATCNIKDLHYYKKSGINRISIGAQSFDDKSLLALNRAHNKKQIKQSVLLCQGEGFDNINLDIIYGIKQQDPKQAQNDLQQAQILPITHLSWYQLSIEPNTFFYKNKPKLPDEKMILRIIKNGQNYLKSKKFNQYEVSAYAKEGYQCYHNKNYWSYGDFIGIGAGAASKLTLENNKIHRTQSNKNIKKYMQNPADKKKEVLTQQQIILEFMMNNLRLKIGFKKKLFAKRTFLDYKLIEKKINKLITKKQLVDKNGTIRATKKGYLILDSIFADFC
jgi:putative oxygen-independent coproporphyrinogen III oxidase